MPQFERNVYEPGDEPRVFDGSDDEEDIEGSRLPLLIVLALLVLAMFAGVVWLAYTQGVARGRTETPVLTAQAGPARIAPQNPGGAEQSFKGFKIYEQPAPQDDDSAAAQPRNSATASPSAAPPATPPPTVAAKPPAPAMPVPKVAAAPAVTHVAAAAPTAKPEVKTAAPPPPPVKPAPIVADAKSAPQPPQAVGPATAPPRAIGVPDEKPVSAKASSPAKVAPPAALAASASSGAGAYVLQIGAYKSEADADAAWKAYKAKHAALLAGNSSDVQKADLGEKGTWYRLRIAGFSNKDVASALCDRLKADGGGCFLGK